MLALRKEIRKLVISKGKPNENIPREASSVRGRETLRVMEGSLSVMVTCLSAKVRAAQRAHLNRVNLITGR